MFTVDVKQQCYNNNNNGFLGKNGLRSKDSQLRGCEFESGQHHDSSYNLSTIYLTNQIKMTEKELADLIICYIVYKLHGLSIYQYSLLRQKLMEYSIINPALSLLMKHLVIGQCQKAPKSWLFIGHHRVILFSLVSSL